jgi:hypothetical protein
MGSYSEGTGESGLGGCLTFLLGKGKNGGWELKRLDGYGLEAQHKKGKARCPIHEHVSDDPSLCDRVSLFTGPRNRELRISV